jgi:RNA polymerase sigma factor (sigma-70 family)
MHSVIRRLRTVALLGEGGPSDDQLLERFLTERDEAAFEVLVRRHGPMVLGVTRRVLGNTHDAEDVFQATFLILVRKAAALRSRELVGNWLFGVAYRTARRARAMSARRQQKERAAVRPSNESTESDELLSQLDREIERLPDRYRVPVVLCELEGRTRKDVARQLNLPEGTLSSRLATARKLLARRLARYGGLASENLATAAVPQALLLSTLNAATGPKAAASANVIALVEGMVRLMFLTKLRIAGCAVLAFAMLGLGAGGPTYPSPRVEAGQAPAKTTDEVLQDLNRQIAKLSAVRTATDGIRKAVDDLNKHRTDRKTQLEAMDEIERVLKDMKKAIQQEKSAQGSVKAIIKGVDSGNSRISAVLEGTDNPAVARSFVQQYLSEIAVERVNRLHVEHVDFGSNRNVLATVEPVFHLALVVSQGQVRLENLPVAEDVKVLVKGKPAKLGDLKAGMRVTVKLDVQGGITVKSIEVEE